MSLRIAIVLCALPGCLGAGTSECAEQRGPGLTGTVRYVTGDGSELGGLLAGNLRMTSVDSVELTGRIDDEWGRERSYELQLIALSPGMFDLTDHGSLCMPRQSGGEPVCSPVTGPIDVRRLESECYTHSSGISSCIYTIDLSLDVVSQWQDTTFMLDGDELTEGAWVECDL